MPKPNDSEWDDDVSQAIDPPRRRRERVEPEGDATGGIIPYKNPSALIAYYCGLFALFPVLGLFLGIAGLVLGIKGLRYQKLHPEVKGQVHAWIGIVMGGLCAVAWGTCGVGVLLAWINDW